MQLLGNPPPHPREKGNERKIVQDFQETFFLGGGKNILLICKRGGIITSDLKIALTFKRNLHLV